MAGKPRKKKKYKQIRRPPVTWREKSLKEMDKLEIKHAIDRLEEGLKAELPDIMLYAFTGLDRERIEEIKKRNPKIQGMFDEYRNYLKTMSRLAVARDIIDEGDVGTSKWYLEHTDSDFQPASKVDIKGQQVIVPVEQKEEEILKMFEDFFNEGTEGVTGE